MKWFARYAEASQSIAPQFRAVDGIEVEARRDEVIREIIRVDRQVFEDNDEASFGCFERSQTWYEENPNIYTLLFSGSRLVGYSNVMPLEDEAWDLALQGKLHDGLVEADAIRRFELPGLYRLYICCFAILPEYRRFPTAFGTLYDMVFERLFRLAENDIYVSEMAANAWTPEGRSLSKSFGMTPVCPHSRHGEIFHCTIIPPQTVSTSRKLRLLLSRYREVGLIPPL